MIDTSTTTDLVQAELNLDKAKSNTQAKFVKLVDTSFVEKEYGKCETAVLDFSRCKEPFMLPYEFRAKEIDEHPQEENIAKSSSVEEEHQSEKAQDPEKKEEEMLENRQEADHDIVQVIQPPYSPNMIDFANKKILVRSDQTESTKGKNVVIDHNAFPRMTKAKNLNVGVCKINEKKRQAPRRKMTVSMLLEKYASHKADNVVSRLGGNKCHRSPTRPGGHERWRTELYDQQPYFAMKPAYRGCTPPMYQQFAECGFNPRVTYSTGLAAYFQPIWMPSRPVFRPNMHRKSARFNHKVRSLEAIIVQGNQSPRRGAYVKNYDRQCKRMWVPVKCAERKSIEGSGDLGAAPAIAEGVVQNTETGDGHGVRLQQTGSSKLEKETNSGPNMQARLLVVSSHASQKPEMASLHADLAVESCSTRTSSIVRREDASIGGKASVQIEATDQETDGNKIQQQCGSALVQKDGIEIGLHIGGDKIPTMSSSASSKDDSVNTRTNSAMKVISSGPCKNVFKSSIGISTQQRGTSSNSCSQKIGTGSMPGSHGNFWNQRRMFEPRMPPYRPKYSGSSRIMSVAPGTKPGPQWCPAGLTHTQKRRVQRLRALEIRQQIEEKKRDKCFSRYRQMVAKKIWKKKCIMTEEDKNVDDTYADKKSENINDAPTDMDVDQAG
jgi:hypothetical protein